MPIATLRNAPTTDIFRIFLLAAAYAVLGRLSLLLAIPPGIAAAFWPAAGLALGCLLIFGMRLWPGVWLGSFSIDLWMAARGPAGLDVTTVVVSASVALGATTQAVLGRLLLCRFVERPHVLQSGRDIARFLLLAAPVSCLISATWSTSSLVASGTIPAESGPFTWWTWWVGDALGVLIVTPLLLTWRGEPREIWRSRRLSVTIPLTLTSAMVVVFFLYAREHERRELDGRFREDVSTMTHAVKDRLHAQVQTLRSIRTLYASSEQVERSEFSSFVLQALGHHHGIQALEWVPRVPHAEREACERAARADGLAGFRISERGADGVMREATERPEYYPVLFVEPVAGNEAAIGYDLGSSPTRRAAMIEARDTGTAVATEEVTLVQETGWRHGFLVFVPIFENDRPTGTVAERRRWLVGYALGVFSVGDLVEAALQNEPSLPMELEIVDRTSGVETSVCRYDIESQRLIVTDDGAGLVDDMEERATIPIADRQWEVRARPTLAYLQRNRPLQAWAGLAIGLIFTGLLGAFLLLVTGRTAGIERLVAERTAELLRINNSLTQEVTVRRRAEEALGESEQRLALAMEAAKLGMWIWDLRNNETYFNDHWYRMIGYEPDELPMSLESWSRVCHPDDLAMSSDAIRRYLEGETDEYRVSVRIQHKNGNWMWIEDVGRVIERDHAGEPVRMAGVHFDIDPLKRVEGALRDGEARLEEATEIARLGHWRFDLDSGRISWSPQGSRLYGLDPDGPAPTLAEFIERIHPEDRGLIRDAVARAREDGDPFTVEFRNVDGRHLTTRGESVRDERGNVTALKGITQDITELKETEAVVREANLQLGRVNQELEQFIYTASQDLKSPVVTIQGFLGHLRQDLRQGRADRLEDFAGRIESAADRMRATIDNLLDLSRVGRTSEERARFPLARLIREILDQHQVELDRAGSRVTVASNLPVISAIRSSIAQILDNLLVNAMKYGCPAHGDVIEITADRVGEELRLAVADHGPGIPAQYRHRVFELFQRLDAKTTGTGIGLTLVKRAAELHGGRVWVEPTPGGGATFVAALPAGIVVAEVGGGGRRPLQPAD